MAQTLLQIVQACVDEIGGMTRPSSVIGSTDTTVRQMLALMNREGVELSARVSANEGWPVLRKEYRFPTVVVTGQTGTLTVDSAVITGIPSTASLVVGYGVSGTGIAANSHILTIDSGTQVTLDYAATASGTGVALTFGKDQYSFPSDIQYFINRTGWDRTSRWELSGPTSAQDWQVLKSAVAGTGFLYRYRIMAGKIFFDPVPNVAHNMVFEYYSNAWCQSSGGTAQTVWTADTDTPILDDYLFTLGLKWRFLRAKGLDYAQEARTYEDAIERTMSRAGTAADISMDNRGGRGRLIDYANVDDSGFGA